MVGESRVGSTARRWDLALACLAGVLVIAAVALAALVAMPPTFANLASEVSDGTEPTAIGEASVVVPEDWIITRNSDDAITVSTPDRALRAMLASVDATPAVVVAEAGATGAPRTELLASGLTAVHADVGDGGVVAGVGAQDATPSVHVIVRVEAPDGRAAADYRPAIGDLLEGIRP